MRMQRAAMILVHRMLWERFNVEDTVVSAYYKRCWGDYGFVATVAISLEDGAKARIRLLQATTFQRRIHAFCRQVFAPSRGSCCRSFAFHTRDSKDIQVWIRAAEKRSVRELSIVIDTLESPPVVELPRSLYRSCRMLVTLKLCNAVLVDDAAYPFSFPSLKKLSLESIKYPNDVFLDKLLSGCPVLEDLVVRQCPGDNVPIVRVRMLHLKSLALGTAEDRAEGDPHGFVIDAPSLECLDIDDYDSGSCVIVNKLSKIWKARLHTGGPHNEKLVGSITSAKRLCLCLPNPKNVYPVSTVFHRLVDLEICTCQTEWLNLLMRVLSDSPKLQSLTLRKGHRYDDGVDVPGPCWNEPSSVPECVSTTLKTFEWRIYEGTEEEKEVVAFILRNGSCLENVTINLDGICLEKGVEMIKALSFLPRRSPTCRITFD
ncbi:unnamed protein product [Thlaspi arvense]|uniref:FBD domain-containing protein n=1 Tax=Thlaspi arvense TaxID=13288 RepID=A0AAU9SMV3_THLAR|nr:unnamed protein product [Thlaspi arvense]